jgi:hypothetical protein
MGWEQLLNHLSEEWQTITHAPLASAVVILIAFGITYGLNRAIFRVQIDSLESRLDLKDDQINDYKRKLDGASPEEAKGRMDALESRLHALLPLVPRRLTDEQRQAITQVAARMKGSIAISFDQASNGALLSGDLQNAFSAALWSVYGTAHSGHTGPLDHGLGVTFESESDPSVQATFEALRAARLDFTAWASQGLGLAPVEILVTARRDWATTANC